MKFFFNKLPFLRERYEEILKELSRRGMPQRSMWPRMDYRKILPLPVFNDYEPTPEALALNRKRIAERMPKQPRYTGGLKPCTD